MAGRNTIDEKIRCSFCGKSQDQVKKLIAGPNGAYICDECVDICAEIIEEEMEDEEPAEGEKDALEINLIKPEEMKAFLDDYVIGQEDAKKVLSVAVYNHSPALQMNSLQLSHRGSPWSVYPSLKEICFHFTMACS